MAPVTHCTCIYCVTFLALPTVDKSGYYEIINGTQGQTNLRSKHKRGRGRGAREWEKNRSLGATTSDTSRWNTLPSFRYSMLHSVVSACLHQFGWNFFPTLPSGRGRETQLYWQCFNKVTLTVDPLFSPLHVHSWPPYPPLFTPAMQSRATNKGVSF